MSKKESEFQRGLIRAIKNLLPGAIVTKMESYIQGFPDLLILYEDRWAALECKRNAHADKQPNQTYYVDRLNDMSFCRFVYPENQEEVLYDLQRSFKSER